MPCPIARVASYYRMQIEIISPAPAAAAGLQQLLAALRNARALVSDARTAVDVDPVDLL
jgi:primosomal protein N'